MLSRARRAAMIAAMKRLLFLLAPLALFLSALPLPAARASAATYDRYAVIYKQNVALFEQPDESTALFVLPYTYFVRILGADGAFTRVEYGSERAPYTAVTGYCRTDDLTPVSFVPQQPYLEYAYRAVFTREDPGGAGSPELVTYTKEAAYYGEVQKNGCLYYYVFCDGKFLLSPEKSSLDYTLNTEYKDYLANVPAAVAGGADGLSAGAIAGICVACVAAVAVAVFVAHGKRAPSYDPGRAEF